MVRANCSRVDFTWDAAARDSASGSDGAGTKGNVNKSMEEEPDGGWW